MYPDLCEILEEVLHDIFLHLLVKCRHKDTAIGSLIQFGGKTQVGIPLSFVLGPLLFSLFID